MGNLFFGSSALLSLIFIILIVTIPLSIYSAQKWAHLCYKELKKLNKTLDTLKESTDTAGVDQLSN